MNPDLHLLAGAQLLKAKLQPTAPAAPGRTDAAAPDFAAILKGRLKGAPLKFSAHAESRLESRNISLSDGELDALNAAAAKAEAKGARDTLVMMGDVAFIVNIQNRTVVTAVDRESMSEHVFTSIDSAVVV